MSVLKIHHRFVARSVLLAVLATWVVLAGFATLGALLDQVDDFGQGNYGFGQALLYVGWQLPRRAHESFPMAAVIGCVLAIGGHAARSELVALRAAGLAPTRIATTALAVVFALALPLVLASDWAIPDFERRAHVLKLTAMEHEVTLAGGANVWAREGSEVFNAQGGERQRVDGRTVLVFAGVSVYAFDPQGRLAWIQEATQAEYDETRGWVLREVRRTTFGPRSVAVETFAEQIWATALEPGAIEASLQHPSHLTSASIRAQIAHMQRMGLDAGALRDAYWSRWFQPITTLALVFAALPFAFGQRRSGGFGQRLFVGIVFALVARLAQPMLVNLAQAFQLSIVLAYALPVLLLLAIGFVGFRRR